MVNCAQNKIRTWYCRFFLSDLHLIQKNSNSYKFFSFVLFKSIKNREKCGNVLKNLEKLPDNFFFFRFKKKLNLNYLNYASFS